MKDQLHALTAFLFSLTTAVTCSFGQAGELDASFATAGMFSQDFGFQDNLTKVRIQPDGRIVTVGTAITPSFSGKLLVVRLLADGSPDNSFSEDGSLIIETFNESYAYDLFFQPDGKIVVAGARADDAFQFSMLVIRLNADGSIDQTFGTNGSSEPEIGSGDDFAYAMVPLANGQFLLAGTAQNDEFRNVPVVVRMNADGSVDSSFGTEGVASINVEHDDSRFWNVGLQSDGSIVASGQYDQGLTLTGQFNEDVLVARFTAEGVLDPTFGDNGTVITPISAEYTEAALGMAVDAVDNIFLSGYTTLPDFSFDGFVMGMDASGQSMTGFGEEGLAVYNNAAQDVFTGMVLQPDGKILACGTSGGFGFDPRDQLVARFMPDGTLDQAFGTNGFALNSVMGNFDEANALTLQSDGRIVVAGKANNGNNNDVTVLRHLNDLGAGLNDPAALGTFGTFPNPARSGGTLTLDALPGIRGHLDLVDAQGAIVWNSGTIVPNTLRTITLPTLGTGMYLLRWLAEGTQPATTRLVVQ